MKFNILLNLFLLNIVATTYVRLRHSFTYKTTPDTVYGLIALRIVHLQFPFFFVSWLLDKWLICSCTAR